MESHFTISGRKLTLTTKQVETALRGVKPDTIRVHCVDIGGELYPIRQALALATGIDRQECFPQVGARVFRQLGFRVRKKPSRPKRRLSYVELRKALPHRDPGLGPYRHEILDVPPLHLQWFYPERWEDLEEYGASIVDLPFVKSGVYRVWIHGQEGSLVIGKASDLRKRILHGLVWGTAKHQAGERIRANEDLSRLRVQWAITERPAAAEEELHRRHVEKYGRLPKYTFRT